MQHVKSALLQNRTIILKSMVRSERGCSLSGTGLGVRDAMRDQEAQWPFIGQTVWLRSREKLVQASTEQVGHRFLPIRTRRKRPCQHSCRCRHR